MTEINNFATSISNPIARAETKTALSQVSVLSAIVWDRTWQTNSQKNLAVKERLAF